MICFLKSTPRRDAPWCSQLIPKTTQLYPSRQSIMSYRSKIIIEDLYKPNLSKQPRYNYSTPTLPELLNTTAYLHYLNNFILQHTYTTWTTLYSSTYTYKTWKQLYTPVYAPNLNSLIYLSCFLRKIILYFALFQLVNNVIQSVDLNNPLDTENKELIFVNWTGG